MSRAGCEVRALGQKGRACPESQLSFLKLQETSCIVSVVSFEFLLGSNGSEPIYEACAPASYQDVLASEALAQRSCDPDSLILFSPADSFLTTDTIQNDLGGHFWDTACWKRLAWLSDWHGELNGRFSPYEPGLPKAVIERRLTFASQLTSRLLGAHLASLSRKPASWLKNSPRIQGTKPASHSFLGRSAIHFSGQTIHFPAGRKQMQASSTRNFQPMARTI